MPKKLSDSFVEQMKHRIINGDFGIGTPLPTLRELSEEFGCSRSVINVGIAQLESQGYVVTRQRKMNIVNNYLNYGKLEVLQDLTLLGKTELRKTLFNDILQARELIEVKCVETACNMCTEADYLTIRRIVEKERELVADKTRGMEGIIELDCRFHVELVRLSENKAYLLIRNSFKDMELKLTEAFYTDYPDLYPEIVALHERLIKEMIQRDSKKAKSTLLLILAGGKELAAKNRKNRKGKA